jgi:anti-sigma B factor antagonist
MDHHTAIGQALSRIHIAVTRVRGSARYTACVINREPFAFDIVNGHEGSTRVLRLTGALVIQEIFELQSALMSEYPPVTIFDLSGVPYMDSAGMGVIINYYIASKRRGNKVIVAGACNRVLELFKLTHVDTIIPMTTTAEEAEALA